MSLSAEYEDFYYRACLCDQPDPVAAWAQQSEETQRLADWIQGHEEVHITGPRHRSAAERLRPNLHSGGRAATTCPTASSSPARSRTR